MARANKFKRPTGPQPPTATTATATRPPSAPSSSVAAAAAASPRPSSRRKTSATPWPDGNEPPPFLPTPDPTPSTAAPTTAAAPAPAPADPDPDAAPRLRALRAAAFEPHILPVRASTRIGKAAARAVALLGGGPRGGGDTRGEGEEEGDEGGKSVVVVLTTDPAAAPPPARVGGEARGEGGVPAGPRRGAAEAAASKVVSVAEIAKRALGEAGGEWFQYSGVGGRVVGVPRRRRGPGAKGGAEGAKVDEGGGEGEDEDEDPFEVMGLDDGGAGKVRCVPVLTVYLSRRRVGPLVEVLGEQRGGGGGGGS